jgi:hypothetical protein
MTTARGDRSSAPDPGRLLRRALRRYLAKVEALRRAESDYGDVVLIERLRREHSAKPGSGKRVSAALDALVDAVVDLQGAHLDALALAADEDSMVAGAGTLGEALLTAQRHCVGYLEARTYDQVRETARHNAARATVTGQSVGVASA